eukprot:Rmarinus@m.203
MISLKKCIQMLQSGHGLGAPISEVRTELSFQSAMGGTSYLASAHSLITYFERTLSQEILDQTFMETIQLLPFVVSSVCHQTANTTTIPECVMRLFHSLLTRSWRPEDFLPLLTAISGLRSDILRTSGRVPDVVAKAVKSFEDFTFCHGGDPFKISIPAETSFDSRTSVETFFSLVLKLPGSIFALEDASCTSRATKRYSTENRTPTTHDGALFGDVNDVVCNGDNNSSPWIRSGSCDSSVWIIRTFLSKVLRSIPETGVCASKCLDHPTCRMSESVLSAVETGFLFESWFPSTLLHLYEEAIMLDPFALSPVDAILLLLLLKGLVFVERAQALLQDVLNIFLWRRSEATAVCFLGETLKLASQIPSLLDVLLHTAKEWAHLSPVSLNSSFNPPSHKLTPSVGKRFETMQLRAVVDIRGEVDHSCVRVLSSTVIVCAFCILPDERDKILRLVCAEICEGVHLLHTFPPLRHSLASHRATWEQRSMWCSVLCSLCYWEREWFTNHLQTGPGSIDEVLRCANVLPGSVGTFLLNALLPSILGSTTLQTLVLGAAPLTAFNKKATEDDFACQALGACAYAMVVCGQNHSDPIPHASKTLLVPTRLPCTSSVWNRIVALPPDLQHLAWDGMCPSIWGERNEQTAPRQKSREAGDSMILQLLDQVRKCLAEGHPIGSPLGALLRLMYASEVNAAAEEEPRARLALEKAASFVHVLSCRLLDQSVFAKFLAGPDPFSAHGLDDVILASDHENTISEEREGSAEHNTGPSSLPPFAESSATRIPGGRPEGLHGRLLWFCDAIPPLFDFYLARPDWAARALREAGREPDSPPGCYSRGLCLFELWSTCLHLLYVRDAETSPKSLYLDTVAAGVSKLMSNRPWLSSSSGLAENTSEARHRTESNTPDPPDFPSSSPKHSFTVGITPTSPSVATRMPRLFGPLHTTTLLTILRACVSGSPQIQWIHWRWVIELVSMYLRSVEEEGGTVLTHPAHSSSTPREDTSNTFSFHSRCVRNGCYVMGPCVVAREPVSSKMLFVTTHSISEVLHYVGEILVSTFKLPSISDHFPVPLSAHSERLSITRTGKSSLGSDKRPLSPLHPRASAEPYLGSVVVDRQTRPGRKGKRRRVDETPADLRETLSSTPPTRACHSVRNGLPSPRSKEALIERENEAEESDGARLSEIPVPTTPQKVSSPVPVLAASGVRRSTRDRSSPHAQAMRTFMRSGFVHYDASPTALSAASELSSSPLRHADSRRPHDTPSPLAAGSPNQNVSSIRKESPETAFRSFHSEWDLNLCLQRFFEASSESEENTRLARRLMHYFARSLSSGPLDRVPQVAATLLRRHGLFLGKAVLPPLCFGSGSECCIAGSICDSSLTSEGVPNMRVDETPCDSGRIKDVTGMRAALPRHIHSKCHSVGYANHIGDSSPTNHDTGTTGVSSDDSENMNVPNNGCGRKQTRSGRLMRPSTRRKVILRRAPHTSSHTPSSPNAGPFAIDTALTPPLQEEFASMGTGWAWIVCTCLITAVDTWSREIESTSAHEASKWRSVETLCDLLTTVVKLDDASFNAWHAAERSALKVAISHVLRAHKVTSPSVLGRLLSLILLCCSPVESGVFVASILQTIATPLMRRATTMSHARSNSRKKNQQNRNIATDTPVTTVQAADDDPSVDSTITAPPGNTVRENSIRTGRNAVDKTSHNKQPAKKAAKARRRTGLVGADVDLDMDGLKWLRGITEEHMRSVAECDVNTTSGRPQGLTTTVNPEPPAVAVDRLWSSNGTAATATTPDTTFDGFALLDYVGSHVSALSHQERIRSFKRVIRREILSRDRRLRASMSSLTVSIAKTKSSRDPVLHSKEEVITASSPSPGPPPSSVGEVQRNHLGVRAVGSRKDCVSCETCGACLSCRALLEGSGQCQMCGGAEERLSVCAECGLCTVCGAEESGWENDLRLTETVDCLSVASSFALRAFGPSLFSLVNAYGDLVPRGGECSPQRPVSRVCGVQGRQAAETALKLIRSLRVLLRKTQFCVDRRMALTAFKHCLKALHALSALTQDRTAASIALPSTSFPRGSDSSSGTGIPDTTQTRCQSRRKPASVRKRTRSGMGAKRHGAGGGGGGEEAAERGKRSRTIAPVGEGEGAIAGSTTAEDGGRGGAALGDSATTDENSSQPEKWVWEVALRAGRECVNLVTLVRECIPTKDDGGLYALCTAVTNELLRMAKSLVFAENTPPSTGVSLASVIKDLENLAAEKARADGGESEYLINSEVTALLASLHARTFAAEDITEAPLSCREGGGDEGRMANQAAATASSAKPVAIKAKTKRKTALRSRNPYVDQVLAEEGGNDSFEDLEDWIVPDDHTTSNLLPNPLQWAR